MSNSRTDVISTPQKVYLDWFWGYTHIPLVAKPLVGVRDHITYRSIPSGIFKLIPIIN